MKPYVIQHRTHDWDPWQVCPRLQYDTLKEVKAAFPGDVVERMVLCYRAPALAYRHLRETGSLISYVVPELEARSALESAVLVFLALKRLAPSAERLLEITQGGVGQREQAEFNRITADLRELARPYLELDVFWRDTGKEQL